MTTQADTHDLFVSYARADNASGWITRFVEELQDEHKKFSAGHELKPFFDQQFVQKLAGLTKLPEADHARLIAETPPVVKHRRRRQRTHNQPFCDDHAFFDAGLDALHRELKKLAEL